jgi:hypothetical protein
VPHDNVLKLKRAAIRSAKHERKKSHGINPLLAPAHMIVVAALYRLKHDIQRLVKQVSAFLLL